jgi:hypothetical protein
MQPVREFQHAAHLSALLPGINNLSILNTFCFAEDLQLSRCVRRR